MALEQGICVYFSGMKQTDLKMEVVLISKKETQWIETFKPHSLEEGVAGGRYWFVSVRANSCIVHNAIV